MVACESPRRRRIVDREGSSMEGFLRSYRAGSRERLAQNWPALPQTACSRLCFLAISSDERVFPPAAGRFRQDGRHRPANRNKNARAIAAGRLLCQARDNRGAETARRFRRVTQSRLLASPAIQAAKNTAQLIPLCHPLPLNYVALDFEVGRKRDLRFGARWLRALPPASKWRP